MCGLAQKLNGFEHRKMIHFHNRYTEKTETEQIYGESWLRWAYETKLGRGFLHTIIKRIAFSQWYGWYMSRQASAAKIQPFIRDYGIDVSTSEKPPKAFATFNDFFTRRLKPGARPIDSNPDAVIFPADGRHLGFANIQAVETIFAKGQRFDLTSLIGSTALAADYHQGSLVISRLCPIDCHRFHFPAAGVPSSPHNLCGFLYSVNPIALCRNLAILWHNKRVITELDTQHLGRVLLLEIGATCVGSIHQTHTPRQFVNKGQEKGYFAFGGSSVITIFEPQRVQLAEDLLNATAAGLELYAHMGDRLGVRSR